MIFSLKNTSNKKNSKISKFQNGFFNKLREIDKIKEML